VSVGPSTLPQFTVSAPSFRAIEMKAVEAGDGLGKERAQDDDVRENVGSVVTFHSSSQHPKLMFQCAAKATKKFDSSASSRCRMLPSG
jgi:hypothetical protein